MLHSTCFLLYHFNCCVTAAELLQLKMQPSVLLDISILTGQLRDIESCIYIYICVCVCVCVCVFLILFSR